MSDNSDSIQNWSCPLPLPHKDKIVLGHGSGGKMTHDLIKIIFWKYFKNSLLNSGNDAAVFLPTDTKTITGSKFAICTDSHVVSPLFFPGGDIGRLAISGTVNDLSMMGATPYYLTAGFILEEGLEINLLEKILASMQQAAGEAKVNVVAGDTKVVQKGKADGLYINTTGFGVISPGVNISGENAKPGDVVIVSGPIGDHGIAVLTARGELGFETDIRSDVAPLNCIISSIVEASNKIHVLRDPTRGGLGTTLNEIAHQSGVCITIEEATIPVRPAVSSACEVLGFDPLYIANEGKFVVIVDPVDASKVLDVIHANPLGSEAQIIGEVQSKPQDRVLLKTTIGTTRIVDMLAGEILPRIC